MSEQEPVKDLLKKSQGPRGKRVAYLVITVVALAILFGAVIVSFRGTDVEESTAAMVEAVPQPSLDAGAPHD